MRFTPASGPPSCCIAPPVIRPPRSIVEKPRPRTARSPRPSRRRRRPKGRSRVGPRPRADRSRAPPRRACSRPSRRAHRRRGRRQPRSRSCPLRSLGSKSFVASITIWPLHSSPSTASWTLGHGTAMTTMSGRRRLLHRPCRSSVAERRDHRRQRFRAAAVGDHDRAAGPQRGPCHRLPEPAGADDANVLGSIRFLSGRIRSSRVNLRAVAQVEADRLHDGERRAGREHVGGREHAGVLLDDRRRGGGRDRVQIAPAPRPSCSRRT